MKKLTFSIFFAVLAISCLTAEVRIRADVGGSVQIGNRNALKEGIDVRLGADIPVWNGLEIPVYVSVAFGNIERERSQRSNGSRRTFRQEFNTT